MPAAARATPFKDALVGGDDRVTTTVAEGLENAHKNPLIVPSDLPFGAPRFDRVRDADYLPAIGRSTQDPRVLYAFGHQHLGLTLGPVTGEIVATIACDGHMPKQAEALSALRFA